MADTADLRDLEQLAQTLMNALGDLLQAPDEGLRTLARELIIQTLATASSSGSRDAWRRRGQADKNAVAQAIAALMGNADAEPYLIHLWREIDALDGVKEHGSG